MMTKGLFALLLAGSLMVPLITPAMGGESTVGLGGAPQAAPPRASWDGLPLPPVPHLDTMQWLNARPAIKGLKTDVLLGPKLETLGPFLISPVASSPPQFSSGIRPREAGTTTQ
jgi:hypothetical protein